MDYIEEDLNVDPDIEAMRETLKVLGTKSEGYYDLCSAEQVEIEYNRLTL